jgi:transposase
MRLQTILNRVVSHKGFVMGDIRFVEHAKPATIEVEIRARSGSRGECSGCGRRRPGYDTLPARRFEFIPLWGFLVFFVYAQRRVECDRCGVKVERVPWAEGKHQLTTAYAWFLARWARRMSWSEVAVAFHTSWHHVFASVELAVAWGREHMSLEGISAIGVDEMAWGVGHVYVTVVYQINDGMKRLLWVAPGRTVRSLLGFFRWLGVERSRQIEFVCSDMWKPYLKVIARKAADAVHILDRFHIMMHVSKAIDKIRAQEVKQLKARGEEPVLTKSRWLLLKRPENMTDGQFSRLGDLVRLNLRSVRAWIMKEDLVRFWSYVSPHWAGVFLDRWCERAMKSRLEPMKQVARMLRNHRSLILNWFRAKKQFSCGIVEGLNGKAKVVTKRAYGFRSFKHLQVALYHTLGNLPERHFAHEFF